MKPMLNSQLYLKGHDLNGCKDSYNISIFLPTNRNHKVFCGAFSKRPAGRHVLTENQAEPQ